MDYQAATGCDGEEDSRPADPSAARTLPSPPQTEGKICNNAAAVERS
jgi:hypothetical protein